jgi:hypothetical protein
MTRLEKIIVTSDHTKVSYTLLMLTGWDRETLKNAETAHLLQLIILRAQDELEKGIEEKGHPFLADRGLDPLAYNEWYAERQNGFKSIDLNDDVMTRSLELRNLTSTENMIRRYRRALVVMLEPRHDCIVNDGVRPEVEDIKHLYRFNEILTAILEKEKIPFYKIGSTVPLNERIKVVIKLLQLFSGQ